MYSSVVFMSCWISSTSVYSYKRYFLLSSSVTGRLVFTSFVHVILNLVKGLELVIKSKSIPGSIVPDIISLVTRFLFIQLNTYRSADVSLGYIWGIYMYWCI